MVIYDIASFFLSICLGHLLTRCSHRLCRGQRLPGLGPDGADAAVHHPMPVGVDAEMAQLLRRRWQPTLPLVGLHRAAQLPNVVVPSYSI
jgi:hypothetical protein